MSQRQFGQEFDGLAQALAKGLSRRKALRLLVQGAVGGLLVNVAQEAASAQAQTIYLPSLLNNATPGASGDLCSEEPDCAEEECCTATTAVNFNWFRNHLLNEILPKWLLARTDQGLFLPHFDRQWQSLKRNYGTVVTQCRLLYNFSEGYALTRNNTYREAVIKGAQFLLNHFRDTQHGGWYWSCNLDGSVRDNTKESYGHAFALFGLAHAYRCTGYPALQEAMMHSWNILKYRFRDSYGGYHRRMTRDFTPFGNIKSQNPLMHTFEALLAAGTVGEQPQLLKEARTLGDFIFDNLVRPDDHRLPEIYDLEWNELPSNGTESGGHLNIGHAFEWAFLASRAAELGFPSRYQTYANRFLNYALALGFDEQRGGIYSTTTPDGVIINKQEKGWWEQSEAIRALVHFHLRHQRQDCLSPLTKMLNFVKGHLIDPQYGGWYSRLEADGTPISTTKGSDWKVDYHVAIMCMEAIRLTS